MKQTVTMVVAAALAVLLFTGEGAQAQEGKRPLTYPIVDTGQTRCFSESGPIPFPSRGARYFGQDGQYAGNQPNYKDNGDGTVTDLVTGLQWQKSPAPKTLTWEESPAYAESLVLGDHKDWRVPTMKELFSIADFRGDMKTRTPYINTKYFHFDYPDPALGVRDIDAQYWSSNLYVGTTMAGDTSAFGFNFADGRIKCYPAKSTAGGRRPPVSRYLRCVRGKPYGANNFKDNRDGTVTDQATGLVWTRAASPKDLDWKGALSYAEGLKLAGSSDWRLPNVKELQSLVDYTHAPDARTSSAIGLAIDPIFKLRGTDPWCWTGTTHIENGHGYYVCFGRALSAKEWRGAPMNAHGAGAVRSDPKSGDPGRWPNGLGPQSDEIRINNQVLCVRGGARPVTKEPTRTTNTAPSKATTGLKVITVGTGSPVYNAERSGPSALIRNQSGSILVDMGNGTQARLASMGIGLNEIKALFFTHHHLDHNEEFAPILIKARLKRSAHLVVGPAGTKKRVEQIFETNKEDIQYRAKKTGRTWEEISKVEVKEVKGGEKFTLLGMDIRTAEMVHTIATVAYRFDQGDDSIVISGDTSYTGKLGKLAKGADIMVMDSGGLVYTSGRSAGNRRQGSTRGQKRTGNRERRGSDKAHASLDEVAKMAAESGIAKMVLTHFRAGKVDEKASTTALAKVYGGKVLYGVDMMEYSPSNPMGKKVASTGRSPSPRRDSTNRGKGSNFIRRLDKNGDGKVSRDEFDGPARGFDRRDRNRDGYIDADEAPNPRQRQGRR